MPLIFAGLGAAGGVAGGVASAVPSAKNASAAAAQIAEKERHNREIESQLKSGANPSSGGSTGAAVGNGIVSDAASKIPVGGPFIVPILKRLGLGLADINTITKGGCIDCNGICLKTVGGGLFIHGVGNGLNLGTQNAGAGIVSGAGLFLGQKLQ